MSDFSEVKARLAALLNGIDDVGNVLTDNPDLTGWGEFLEKNQYTTGAGAKQIRTWLIDRKKITEQWATAGATYPLHEFALYGYFGYRVDPTSGADNADEFHEIAEAVLDCLREDFTLGGAIDLQKPPTAIFHGLRRFGPVDCWMVEISLIGEIDKSV